MSSSSGIGSTLTGGIQDVAGILPLLGTEQCSIHVSSALTRGYLYAASAPMSIFGSLGVVNAGFKTFLACFSLGCIEGAEILENIGFEPQGENLSLIMLEGGKGEKKRYLIENRIDELIEQLSIDIDKTQITKVFHKSAAWNFWMMASTALLCAVSITPYIYVNLGANSLDLKRDSIWVFPILRSTGGFLTATLIQLLIQRRIILISDEYLVKRDGDVEVAAGVKKKKKYQTDALTLPLLFLLFIGLLASVVGYVGCFSIVQNSASASGPISWLCLEAGLSLFRLVIWAWNPKCDDAPPLDIHFELDKHNPLPTCNKDSAEIFLSKVLPLTRARDFLKSITSFVGLIEPFRNPDLSLYYTLTRKRPYKEGVSENTWDAKNHEPGERTLYITVFDHKERTTRVYTRNDEKDAFYSTKSDAPQVDVGHHLLEVEIDTEIVDFTGDPVCSDMNIRDSLQKHHRSILEQIWYQLGAANATRRTYAIENRWTMNVDDTISTPQRLWKENGNDWKAGVEKGRKKERTDEPLASDYFMHSSIERQRELLDEGRGKWIARRMEMITKETKERLLGVGMEYRGNKLGTKSPEEVNEMLDKERCVMELLLIYEVGEWELRFWKKFEAFRDQIDGDRVDEKERMTREWRANCWKRLDTQKHAALKRMADLDITDKDNLLEEWESSIPGRLLSEGVENPNSISLSKLRREIGDGDGDEEREIHLRMEKEIEDIEFRLKRGSDLGRFDQFWDDDLLFNCRYSRSKWLEFNQYHSTVPLEVYSHALKRNKNITHISFDGMKPDFDLNQFLRDLPCVTSISPDRSVSTIPAVNRDLLFIKSPNNDLHKFAEKIRSDPSTTYIFSDAVSYSGKLGSDAKVLISFVPKSDKRLVLRVKHSGQEDASLEVTLGSTKSQINPSSKSSLTIDNITLYPKISIPVFGPSGSDHLSFVPKVRNDIFIRFVLPYDSHFHGHYLHDVELLDDAGQEYTPHSASFSFNSV